ncbi:MAG: hypothetical protein LAP87_24635 [Acidobacteriia bacterium]|nr:hypothetical protein [Terriglobia bacterium]
MRIIAWTAILLASSLMGVLYAAPQSGNLVQQLQSTYIPNVMDASGIRVAQAGSILAVQLDGVQATPRSRITGAFCNDFENGQIKPCGGLGSIVRRPAPIANARPLAAGEKVYLLKTEMQNNAIVFQVQSCGTCNPKSVDPAHLPFRADVKFKFIKNALAATDFKSVQGVIEQVFKIADAEADSTDAGADAGEAQPPPAAPGKKRPPQQQTAQPQREQAAPPPPEPAKFDPIPPPPPPPAAPATPAKIMGMTVDEVKAKFGEPEQIVEAGEKTIYKYKDIKVTFVKGKVADIE